MDISIIIVTVIICYLILKYANSHNKPNKHNNKRSQLSNPSKKINYPDGCHAWPPLNDFQFEVVGESYYQAAIAKLASEQEEGCASNPNQEIKPLTAYLIPDDNNQYDNKAVRVDINGMQVGYLSREDARSFRRRLGTRKLTGQITTCGALITGGGAKDGKQMSYGVALDMKPFE